MSLNNFVLCFIGTFMLFGFNLQAQNKLTDQPESLYKKNNVKLRHWYSGTNKLYEGTSYFDREGRMIRWSKPSNFGFTDNLTYYDYDADGKLISIIDSIKTRMPIEMEIEELEAAGLVTLSFQDEIKVIPPLEVFRYELFYQGDHLIRLSKFNPDESLMYIDSSFNEGLTHKKYSYWKEDLYQVEETTYSASNRIKRQRGWKYYRGSKYEWDDTFEYVMEGNRIQSFTKIKMNGEAATANYLYDITGLLSNTNIQLFGTKEYTLIDVYVYEYFE